MKFLRFLLFPFSIIYDLVTTVRNFLFDKGFFKETSFKIPIIAVGNLNVGGTGKTPQIEYLIRLLKDSYQLSVLSRGYKRSTKEYVLLDEFSSAEEVGDEPLQYFKKFENINVAVDVNRVNGISNLIATKETEAILLDDAYQHRKVKASFYVLLTKYNDLFINDFLLPTGSLRESRAGAKRADVIVVTKCPVNISDSDQKNIKKILKKFKKPIFFTTISYADKTRGSHSILMNNLNEYEILLITGIANPTPLLKHLESLNVKFIHLKYSDHHNFSDLEIKKIQSDFSEISSIKKMILTTEKDYTRLVSKIEEVSYLPIETSFINDDCKVFDETINHHLTKFKKLN
jgi:tetraacyldisaccharide 4'-kinase